MPSLFAGMPFVSIVYRNSCRYSSGLLAEAPLRSSMSRFVILGCVFARDWIRQLLEVRFGVSALYLSGLDYVPWHDALSSPRVDHLIFLLLIPCR